LVLGLVLVLVLGDAEGADLQQARQRHHQGRPLQQVHEVRSFPGRGPARRRRRRGAGSMPHRGIVGGQWPGWDGGPETPGKSLGKRSMCSGRTLLGSGGAAGLAAGGTKGKPAWAAPGSGSGTGSSQLSSWSSSGGASTTVGRWLGRAATGRADGA